MDLTLEILGWVESLEDALTQFTSPEDLDGENMYRCGRYDDRNFVFSVTITCCLSLICPFTRSHLSVYIMN